MSIRRHKRNTKIHKVSFQWADEIIMNKLQFFALLFVLMTGFFSCARKPIDSVTTPLSLEYPHELQVVKREQWNWQPGERTLPEHVISKITIHHGGEDFPSDKDPLKYMQTFQEWCRREKQWIDNPYHFMIDLKGIIYEARPINLPGDTNTGYDVNGHALICVMGNYENQILSQQQLNSLIDLTAFLAKRFDVSVESIKGHQDYTETLCPGMDLYRYLQDGTIITRVKEKLNLQQ